jgi:hypothetical protein
MQLDIRRLSLRTIFPQFLGLDRNATLGPSKSKFKAEVKLVAEYQERLLWRHRKRKSVLQ